MSAPAITTRRDKRRQLRAATRRRVRGGERLAPVPLQRAARTVDDAAHVGAERLRRAFAGDRPFLLGFLVLLVMGVTVISAPLRSYLDQRDRVELLEEQAAVLEQANAGLQQRAEDLTDPQAQELMARERFGYIFPGEVPYVVVPPQRDPTTISENLTVEAREEQPWYREAWGLLTGWFG